MLNFGVPLTAPTKHPTRPRHLSAVRPNTALRGGPQLSTRSASYAMVLQQARLQQISSIVWGMNMNIYILLKLCPAVPQQDSKRRITMG